MALLLDTNALLWYLQDSPSLSLVAKNAIDAAGLDVVVSTASIWEISIKVQTGKLVSGPGFGCPLFSNCSSRMVNASNLHPGIQTRWRIAYVSPRPV
jgi:hypothetical protein